MNQKTNIGFIGAGNMAKAMIAGLCAQGFPAQQIMACARSNEKLILLQKQWGVITTQNNSEVIKHADIVILATKPNDFTSILNLELLNCLHTKQPLIISIMAGMRIHTLENSLNSPLSIVRCMPNVAATVARSITGVYANSKTSLEQKTTVNFILQSIGTTIWMDQEQQMEAFTALCGSGPAYFFLLFEALSHFWIAKGDSYRVAKTKFLEQADDTTTLKAILLQVFECFEYAAKQLPVPLSEYPLLVRETAIGSLLLAKSTPQDFDTLRQSVTSKGGTTQAALNVLLQGNITDYFHNQTLLTSADIHAIKGLFTQALKAAYLRAIEIGDELDKQHSRDR